MGRREDRRVAQISYDLARYVIYFGKSVDLVAEKLHAEYIGAGGGREYLDNVAPYSEAVTLKAHVVAVVIYGNELSQKCVSLHYHAGTE